MGNLIETKIVTGEEESGWPRRIDALLFPLTSSLTEFRHFERVLKGELSEKDPQTGPLLTAMKAACADDLSFSPIGIIHEVVDDWVNWGKPWRSVDSQIRPYEENAEKIFAVANAIKPHPDAQGDNYSERLMLTLIDAISLNAHFEKIAARNLQDHPLLIQSLQVFLRTPALKFDDDGLQAAAPVVPVNDAPFALQMQDAGQMVRDAETREAVKKINERLAAAEAFYQVLNQPRMVAVPKVTKKLKPNF